MSSVRSAKHRGLPADRVQDLRASGLQALALADREDDRGEDSGLLRLGHAGTLGRGGISFSWRETACRQPRGRTRRLRGCRSATGYLRA